MQAKVDEAQDGSMTFAANRAVGDVTVEVKAVDGQSRRGASHESGSLRVRFPSPEGEGLSAVLVNTAGGIAGGDRFGIDFTVGEAARLTVTTAAAEKVYRSHGPQARIDVKLRVSSGGRLIWLPQETILFDRAAVARNFEIDIADDAAELLMCEIVVFGRAAMGETMRQGAFVDRWRLRRGGRLVFAENIRLDGDIGAKLARPAIGKGAVAVATVLIAPGDEALVERLRATATGFGAEVGISAWNGFAMVRFCAQDASMLRGEVIAMLRGAGARLPRLWLQ
ncbi:urease accessory protein UreD [Bradyrhizobium sp. WD16]|uniref:urease accessory protein UreD n=1 Tax=Bradyrhizobium sp. WD16 TaxID=1521768 RepID=UPI0020A58844|nr:urease accessory protein UreD [Bradyrhizobium sp. WD16]UTD27460.1 urease accessory protein ureD [Bradyrhizobium sp. WD16]